MVKIWARHKATEAVLVVGGWRLVAVGGGWWVVVVGDWWLAVGGGWWLEVPGAVLKGCPQGEKRGGGFLRAPCVCPDAVPCP